MNRTELDSSLLFHLDGLAAHKTLRMPASTSAVTRPASSPVSTCQSMVGAACRSQGVEIDFVPVITKHLTSHVRQDVRISDLHYFHCLCPYCGSVSSSWADYQEPRLWISFNLATRPPRLKSVQGLEQLSIQRPALTTLLRPPKTLVQLGYV